MTPYMEMKLMAEAAESNRLEVQSKLDRVTAERDAALGREAALREELNISMLGHKNTTDAGARAMADRDALQQRLTAADERADVLEGLLRRVVESSVLSFEQDAPEALESLEAEICAALKPAEGGVYDEMTDADWQLKDDMDRYDDEKWINS